MAFTFAFTSAFTLLFFFLAFGRTFFLFRFVIDKVNYFLFTFTLASFLFTFMLFKDLTTFIFIFIFAFTFTFTNYLLFFAFTPIVSEIVIIVTSDKLILFLFCCFIYRAFILRKYVHIFLWVLFVLAWWLFYVELDRWLFMIARRFVMIYRDGLIFRGFVIVLTFWILEISCWFYVLWRFLRR